MSLASVFIDAVSAVTRQWAKVRRAEERAAARSSRRQELLHKTERVTFKDAAETIIPEAYAEVSSGGKYPAHARQIMYRARPHLQDATDQTLDDQYFCQQLLPDFIAAHPEPTSNWDVVYDARGHFLEPHTGREVPLGTLAVREYVSEVKHFEPGWIDQIRLPELYPDSCQTCGPRNRFGAILFVEKEGFAPLFRAVQLAERFDVAVMSTKGVSNTASRALVDDLAAYARDVLGRPLPLLVLHDFDKAGFTILGTFTRSTRRYQYEHDVQVVDLGLRLADVKKLGLVSEQCYVKGEFPESNLRENGAADAEIRFLLSGRRESQGVWGQRVELNAMTSEQLITWLEGKLVAAGVKKVVPPDDVLRKAYRQLAAEQELQRIVAQAEKSLIDAGGSAPVPAGLRRKVATALKKEPALSWDKALTRIVDERGG